MPEVIFASTPEHDPVIILVTISVAKFLASACGMMKIIRTV
jgi:hypothetical protein